jgi:hypothetical protein
MVDTPEFQPVFLYSENAQNPNDYGKLTTDITKMNEVRATQRMIQTTRPGFLKDWVSSNPLAPEHENHRMITQTKLAVQMERYNIRVSMASMNSSTPRYIVTGKMDIAGNRNKDYHDDLIVCLCMCVGMYYDVLTDSLCRKFNYVSERKNKKKK